MEKQKNRKQYQMMKIEKKPINPAESERSIPISSYLHWTRCFCPPDKGVVQRTTDALKIDEQQVSYRCLPFSLLATTWLSTARYHPALIL